MTHRVIYDSEAQMNKRQFIIFKVFDDSFQRCFSDGVSDIVVWPHQRIELL